MEAVATVVAAAAPLPRATAGASTGITGARGAESVLSMRGSIDPGCRSPSKDSRVVSLPCTPRQRTSSRLRTTPPGTSSLVQVFVEPQFPAKAEDCHRVEIFLPWMPNISWPLPDEVEGVALGC